MNLLVAPTPREGFKFWDGEATLALPSGMPPVNFEYLTEPPHGDPQYKITVDRIAVGGGTRPIGFFGRDLHLSPCSRFLAATSLSRIDSFFHVIDLTESKYWSWAGFVHLQSISAKSLKYRRYVFQPQHQLSEDPEQEILLADLPWVDIWLRPDRG
jgi:hypothetical protein